MRKIIIPLLFVCSISFGQMFSAQNAECAGCDTNATEVTIGTQTWMRKNLDVVKYNDNTNIPKVTDNTAWAALTTPAYCWYNNDSATYSATYGALYNWHTVNTGKLCPVGYHVPSKAELETLITYLGGVEIAGGKLKETGTTHWKTPNTGASDSVCFTALPSGWRNAISQFVNITDGLYVWISNEYSSNNSYWSYLLYDNDGIGIVNNNKKSGLSVRCLKD